MSDVKYVEDRRTALTAADLTAMQMRVTLQTDGGDITSLLFAWTCPKCKHPTRDVVPVQHLTEATGGPLADFPVVLDVQPEGDVVVAAEPGRSLRTKIRVPQQAPGQPAIPKQRPVVLTCQCANDHPGAKGKFGCGRSWMLRVAYDPAAPTVAPTVALPTPDDLSHWVQALAAQTAPADPLVLVRGSADKWQKALAATFGVVAVTSLLGRDVLGKLQGVWPEVLTGAVLGVLVLVANGTYFAHEAAIGFPALGSISSADDLDDLGKAPLHQAKKALERLRLAALLSVLAFALSLFALGASLLAPEEAAAATKVKIKIGDAEPACVTLKDSPKEGTLRFTSGDKEPQDVALEDVTQLLGGC